jgi:hypothetical protein
MLQQPTMAQPIASAKKSTRSAVMTAPMSPRNPSHIERLRATTSLMEG